MARAEARRPRDGHTGGPRGRAALVCVGVLVALVGCTPAPPPEEVIRDARLPDGDRWCEIVDDDEVRRLLGEGDIDRVLQSGQVDRWPATYRHCDIVWADGEEAVQLVSVQIAFMSMGGSFYRDTLTNAGRVFGEQRSRLDSGDLVQVRPGAFVDAEREEAAAFLICEEALPLPTVLTATLSPEPTATGSQWTEEQLAGAAERLAALTEREYGCEGETRGLEEGDIESLVARYDELREPSAG